MWFLSSYEIILATETLNVNGESKTGKKNLIDK